MRRVRVAYALPFAAVLVPVSILCVVGWLTWNSVWDDARSQMTRAAESAAEYGRRTLESYSVTADRVNERLRGLSDDDIRKNEQLLHQDLHSMGADLSQSDLTYAIDRNGVALLSSQIFPVPRTISLKDRDYFQALSGPNPPNVYVSTAFPDSFDGKLFFSFARPRRDTGNPPAQDGFDGVVLVAVNPNTLADGMRNLLPTPTDRMAMMRVDGSGISTTSGVGNITKPLPRVDPSSPFYTFANAGSPSAIYVSVTATPGSRALLAMKLIEGFPIYAVSIRPQSEIVARWWSIMERQLIFGIPATIALLLLSLRVWNDQRQLAFSNANLRRDNALNTDRLVRAKRFGLVGTFEFDLRTGLSRRSPEYMSVHGLPAVATEESHDDWARRLHPDDRKRAEKEVIDALSDESRATEYGQTYRIVTASGEVPWIAAWVEIVRDLQGRAVMMLGAHVDVTPLRTTEFALAESDARLRLAQEAVGIGTWEWLPDSRAVRCSPKMMELWGLKAEDGTLPLRELLAHVHPEDRSSLLNLMKEIRNTGGLRIEFRIQGSGAPDGSAIVWIAVRATLADSPQGGPAQLMGIAYDISDRKRAEEFTTLMAQEVEHRAKNTLAIVSGLLRMTKAKNVNQLVEVLDARVRALAGTMGLLRQGGWTGAQLGDIVETTLEYFKSTSSGGSQVTLSGPPIFIDVHSAQPIAMALHELATNAAKYGALSVDNGHLGVTWQVEAGRVHLEWRESGGPAVSGPPLHSGFGSKLIAMLFEGQIGGTIVKKWEPTGLLCELNFEAKSRHQP